MLIQNNGRTALHAAASSGNVYITRRIMETFDEARDVMNFKDKVGLIYINVKWLIL